MTCRDVHHEVLELARGGREATSATHARAHLVNCASCREGFAQQQALTGGLRTLATATRMEELPVALHGRVMRAFAETAGLKSPTSLAPYDPASYDGSRRSAHRSWGAKADSPALRTAGTTVQDSVAPRAKSVRRAVLLLRAADSGRASRTSAFWRTAAGFAAVAVALSWWAFRGSEGSMSPAILPSRAIAPLQGQVVPSLLATPVGRRLAVLPIRGRTAERSASKADPTPHQTPHFLSPEGFMSLPAAAGLPDFERGEILRLEIAVASLPNYGVEIPPDAENRPIEVDILVGQDGHPRAIRLVHLKTRMTFGETPAGTIPVR